MTSKPHVSPRHGDPWPRIWLSLQPTVLRVLYQGSAISASDGCPGSGFSACFSAHILLRSMWQLTIPSSWAHVPPSQVFSFCPLSQPLLPVPPLPDLRWLGSQMSGLIFRLKKKKSYRTFSLGSLCRCLQMCVCSFGLFSLFFALQVWVCVC